MFGNDNEATNEIAGEMFTFIANEIESYRSKFGTMTPGILPVSGNTPFGLEVGALPSGRHAWKPLADGVSPNGGTDTEGPGAVLKSVSHLPHDRFVQGTLLNMKIEPEMLNSENGIMQMMALLKSMCSLGIFHVRFNVIDRETLLAAQERPEEYRGLLIRVVGYTAYFTELGKDVQDEIIARTEQESLYGCSVEENLVKVDAEFAEDIHIRIPVIPTVNMNENNMKDIIKFLSNLKHIKDIELLPYHRLGLETYERLGRVYELKDVEIPDMEMLKKMAEVIRAEDPEAAVKVKGE